MRISGSIFATKGDYLKYAKKMEKANIDFIHIDIFQESKEFNLEDLNTLDDVSIPKDVHLIFSVINDDDISLLNKAKVSSLNVQYETLKNKDSIERISELFDGKFGLAITCETPIEIVDLYIDKISQVLIMCSVPGVSGAKFNETNYDRVALLHNKYPSLTIEVDGGIDKLKGEKMGMLGAEILVSGSYLEKRDSPIEKKSYYLKYMNENNINVKRNMIPFNDLPIIGKRDMFMDAIIKMNEGRLGIVFVVEKRELLGIISAGDVRRGVINYQKDIFDMSAEKIMNTSPFVVEEETYIEDVYDRLFELHKGVEVVPIVNGEKLIGALDLHIGK